MQTSRSLIIERMSQRNFRLNPSETESLERKRFEKRRTGGGRMNSRTNVMDKAGQGQLGRARSAAYGRVGFQHERRTSSMRERDRCGQAIRPGSNKNCVNLDRHIEFRTKCTLFVLTNR